MVVSGKETPYPGSQWEKECPLTSVVSGRKYDICTVYGGDLEREPSERADLGFKQSKLHYKIILQKNGRYALKKAENALGKFHE